MSIKTIKERINIKSFFYPIFLILELPRVWLISLWNSRVLFTRNQEKYIGFHPQNSINSFFYKNQWLNIKRFGRTGSSSTFGFGNYPMERLFYLSPISSFLYSSAGAATTLISTILISLSYLIWVNNNYVYWVFLICILSLISTTFYSMAFARQNYQIIGWVLFPLLMYNIWSGNLLYAIIIISIISLLNITLLYFSSSLILFICILQGKFLPLIILLAGILTFFTQNKKIIFRREFFISIKNIFKIIGGIKHETRYKRKNEGFDLLTIYFLLLYFLSFTLISYAYDSLQYLQLAGIILLLINQTLFRIADIESLILLNSNLIIFSCLINNPNLFAILGLFIGLNPIGESLSIQKNSSRLFIFKPFDHQILVKNVDHFLKKVKNNSIIFAAYEDPKGNYFNLFDGYRIIHELPLWVASLRNINIIPDWYAVGESNYIGGPDLWGRKISEVSKNSKKYNANYILIYQDSKSNLEKKWLKSYVLLEELDWGDLMNQFHPHILWSKNAAIPKWFLLKPKKI